MPSRCVNERPRHRIEHADECRNEHVGIFGFQRAIGGVEHRDRIGVDLRDPE